MSLFGPGAPAERLQELVEIIEAQADLDAQFDVSLSPCGRFPFHIMTSILEQYIYIEHVTLTVILIGDLHLFCEVYII